MKYKKIVIRGCVVKVSTKNAIKLEKIEKSILSKEINSNNLIE